MQNFKYQNKMIIFFKFAALIIIIIIFDFFCGTNDRLAFAADLYIHTYQKLIKVLDNY